MVLSEGNGYLEITDAIGRSRILGPPVALALTGEDVHDRTGHRPSEDAGLLRLVRVDGDDGPAALLPQTLLLLVRLGERGDEGLVLVVVDVEAEGEPPGDGGVHLRRVAAVDAVAGNDVGICRKEISSLQTGRGRWMQNSPEK